MKRNFSILLVSAIAGAMTLTLVSCGGGDHTVSGRIAGLDNDTIFVEWMTLTGMVQRAELNTDTVIASSGRFVYDLDVVEPTIICIEPASLVKRNANGSKMQSLARMAMLMVKPGEKIRVKGSVEPDYLVYTAEGSAFSVENSAHRLAYRTESMKYDSVQRAINAYYSPGSVMPAVERDSLVKMLSDEGEKVFAAQNAIKGEYIEANPSSELSAYYLSRMSTDEFGKYYEHLAAETREGVFSGMLAEREKAYIWSRRIKENEAKIAEGLAAPDFTLKNLAGEDTSLSSFKGRKYLVLDFWGSWCGWCVKGFPKMKEYYEKYNRKLEIVGIDCRDSEEKWRAAVEKNGLGWTQLIDEGSDIDKNVAVLYAVKGYPTKIIVSPDLKIVKVFAGESEDFYQTLDKLLK